MLQPGTTVEQRPYTDSEEQQYLFSMEQQAQLAVQTQSTSTPRYYGATAAPEPTSKVYTDNKLGTHGQLGDIIGPNSPIYVLGSSATDAAEVIRAFRGTELPAAATPRSATSSTFSTQRSATWSSSSAIPSGPASSPAPGHIAVPSSFSAPSVPSMQRPATLYSKVSTTSPSPGSQDTGLPQDGVFAMLREKIKQRRGTTTTSKDKTFPHSNVEELKISQVEYREKLRTMQNRPPETEISECEQDLSRFEELSEESKRLYSEEWLSHYYRLWAYAYHRQGVANYLLEVKGNCNTNRLMEVLEVLNSASEAVETSKKCAERCQDSITLACLEFQALWILIDKAMVDVASIDQMHQENRDRDARLRAQVTLGGIAGIKEKLPQVDPAKLEDDKCYSHCTSIFEQVNILMSDLGY
ncbi:hypothetical protein ABW19_dt0208168 [Dactylella cylindrospora]|nr:hypothetical protein ABW19_dt0208168 [Dactylella cylindrospora]